MATTRSTPLSSSPRRWKRLTSFLSGRCPLGFHDPSHQLKALKIGAPALAVTLQTPAVRGPEDFQGALTTAARQHAQGVVMLSAPSVLRAGARLADLAATRRLPTISMFRQNAVAGCLMSYGPSLTDRYRRIASFAARIVKGA